MRAFDAETGDLTVERPAVEPAFTDLLPVYQAVVPTDRHAPAGKEAGLTAHVGRFFRTLRQRCARFVHKTLSLSREMENHVGALWDFVRLYNACRLQGHYPHSRG